MKRIILLFILSSIAFAQNPPDKPTGLTAAIDDWNGIKAVHLQWNSAQGRDISFSVFRKTNNKPEYIKINTRMHGTMFKDRFVLPDNIYHYYVTASNQFGESLPSDTVSVEISDTVPNAYIFGEVTDDETGDPLQAIVDIIPVLGWSFRHVMTDLSGKYSATVNAGEYLVAFAARGYLHEFYDNNYSIFDAEKISIEADDSLNISAALKSQVSQSKLLLSGRVTNAEGDGLKARVHLVVLNRGFFRHMFRGTATDSLGYYTIPVDEGDSVAVFAEAINRNYLPEFYNDKKDFTEADKFRVSGDLNNIDFILEAKPVYNNSVAGRVANEDGDGLRSTVTAFKLREANSMKFNRTVITDSLGNYKLENLIPGQYLLLAMPIGGYLPSFFTYDGQSTFKWREADSVVIDENSQLIGFNFNLLAVPDSGFARITGVIKDGTGKNINGAMIYALNENGSVSAYSTTDENGMFTMDNLAPGKYTLNTSKFNYDSKSETSVELDYQNNQQANVQMTMIPLTTTKGDPAPEIIRDYKLFQNYPNPFNPVTTIKYQIPNAGMVTLKVYNLIGQEIATLVNSHKPVGEYTIQFDASGLNSGIYFYKLNAGNQVYTRKMIVLK